jgi:hypothetical protein
MSAKRWADAVSALRDARKIDPSPAIELKLGQALSGLGKLLEARRLVAPIAKGDDATPAAKKTRAAARKLLSDIQARIARIQVTIVGPPEGKASTLVDGIDVNLDADGTVLVDPGSHTVTASAESFESSAKEVSCTEGGRAVVELKLSRKGSEPAGAAEPAVAETPSKTRSGSRVPGVTLTVLSVAPLIGASVFGALSLSAASTAKSECPNNVCPASAASDVQRARSYGDASTVGFIAGGAMAAVGIVLIIVAPGDEPAKSARVRPWVGPGAGGLVVNATF